MKKILALLALFTIFCIQPVFAEEQQTDESMLLKLKEYRASMYKNLKFTEEQSEKIKVLDEKLYEDIQPEFKKISVIIADLQNLAYTDDYSEKKLNELKSEFKKTDNKLYEIKTNYEKDFKNILTAKQNRKYIKNKKALKKALKKEIKATIKKQKKDLPQ